MSKIVTTILGIVFLTLVTADDDLPIWSREFDPTALLEPVSRSSNDTAYRLPTNVKPIDYVIYLDLYFEERVENPFSFDGRVYITIEANEPDVTQIVLHANVDSINDLTLSKGNNNEAVALVPGNPYIREEQYHFLKVNLVEAMEVGVTYTLFIDYSNKMNVGPMKRGIWRGTYLDENNLERNYATTHFQPYNARQAFPCWDEPYFKAEFTLHLISPSSYSKSFSNTGSNTVNFLSNGRIQESFNKTPKMSTYLLTFLVSESFEVIAEDTSFSPSIRIIGRSNTAGLGEHALELATKLTRHFDEYFNMPYSTLHPNLLNDHIASPDWASAGTENWGMVSYRELHIIISSNETIMTTEQYGTTLISHELAHKWFGNLVTCNWWSNTWINEGFASYFGYIAGHAAFPQYELDEHFNSRYLQTSLSFDSGANTVAMNHDVNTPAQVTGHFGTISYSKGAAFLRMTVDIISEPTFRKACQYFLQDYKFLPANEVDLFTAFNKAIADDNAVARYDGFNFTEYYDIWVNEPGYPILKVTVNRENGVLQLEQERFFLSGATPTEQIYPIPITYSTNINDFTNLTPAMILTTKTANLSIPEGSGWIIVNNLQHGHYRVTYDENNWELITNALMENPQSIHYLNRAQIVDDVFAYMRSGRMTYAYGFNILRFLSRETNFHVWDPAITGFTWLRNRLRYTDRHGEFDDFILSQMEHVIDELGFDVKENESVTESINRQNILHFACLLGHVRCNQESINRFVAMKNGTWIDPRLRRSVYVTGLREGDDSDFDFLLERFRNSNFANDRLEMLRGLGATSLTHLITRYLELTLTNEVRSHDKVNSFNYVLLADPRNSINVLNFVRRRIADIRTAYVEDSPARPVHTALSNLATYLNEAGLDVYQQWLDEALTGTDLYSSTMSAINSARSNLAWGKANAETILEAVLVDDEPDTDGATVAISSFTLLVSMSLFVILM